MRSLSPVVISGESRGGAPEGRPPLFLDQTGARRAENKFLETAPPPPLFPGSG